MKKIFKTVLALIASAAVFLIVVPLLSIAVRFISEIPFVGTILYWPSDAPWAMLVIPPGAAVFAGAYASAFICGNAKVFSMSIILIYLLNLVLSLIRGAFTWSVLIAAIAAIIPAVICLDTTRADI